MQIIDNRFFLFRKSYFVWIGIAFIYFIIGARFSWKSSIVPAILFTAGQYFLFLINQKQLIQRYYEIYRVKFYLYNLLLILITSLGLSLLLQVYMHFYPSIPVTATPKARILSPIIFHMVFCAIAAGASVFFYLIDKEKKSKVEIEKLKRDKIESELRFLKTQINPHFLFNALNNIYSLAYYEDKKVPDKIAMLSDMLRYVLYDCESDYIPLDMEIEYIKNFIEFQQMKTEKRQNINFEVDNRSQNMRIAPMMLAPLVENGFKHSRIEEDPSGFVDIKLVVDEHKLFFAVRNSILAKNKMPSKQNRERGIGNDNLKNRLDLIYPGKHQFLIEKSSSTYTAKLKLYI